jgi:uroporphyrinogen decarboxylase
MTSRDLFLKTLNFEEGTRTLKWEFGFWGGTVSRWFNEGLPKKKGFERKLVYGEAICGPGLQYPIPSYDDNLLMSYDINSYFNFDKGPSPFPFNWFYFPRFEKKIIEETKEKIEYIGSDGIQRIAFKDERSMPLWIGHPVKNESDWEEIKNNRLNLDNFNDRYTVNNINKFISEAKNRDYPMCVYGSPIGFFGILRLLIGEEKLYYWYYDKPDFIKRILDYLCDFWLKIAEELTSKIDFDYGRFFEDMAYKGGSLISPGIFKEFMVPYYKKLIDFARSKGIKHFIVDSDGYMEDLIPLFKSVGMTGFLPFEIKAGNDIERIREKHPKIGIFGGIDKTVFEDRKGIDKELDKVKRMIEKGGYVPYVDHIVPPNISWKNFKYYREKLNYIIDTNY